MTTVMGAIHLMGMILVSIWGIISAGMDRMDRMDRIYMGVFISLPLSWIIFKDECIISYVIKKIENPHYILGSESATATDLIDLFPNMVTYQYYTHFNHLMRIISLMIVNRRTIKCPNSIFIPMLIMYSILLYRLFTNFSNINKILLCIYLYRVARH